MQQKTPTQKEIRFPLALLPRTAGLSLPTQAFGGVWLNPKFGGFRQGQGLVWCTGEDTKHSRETFAAFPLHFLAWQKGYSGTGVTLAKIVPGPYSPVALCGERRRSINLQLG